MATMTTRQAAAVRGTVLGLILGDAIGATAGKVPARGSLASTCAGQLACYTTEGLIRAQIRSSLKGICYPPVVVWHAYHRWAAMQGIPGIKQWQDEGWPDGWLAQVPVLAERRGSAPATVTALQQQTEGSVDKPVGTSLGAHGLTRSLPAGLDDWSDEPGRLAAEIAARTHRGEAVAAAALGAVIVGLLAQGMGIKEAAKQAQTLRQGLNPNLGAVPLAPALAAASSAPGEASVLAKLAPNAKAVSALLGGIYVALSLPRLDQVRDALLFATTAGDGGHAATVAGALLGAVHGVDALPVDWLSRLELAWVADILARDMIREFAEQPTHMYGFDQDWWNRYPGW